METTATQVETTIIPIESKTTLPYNFFISKHEGKGRNTGLQIADALADLGFTYWISQHQDNADEDSIQQGIRDSEAIILVLTPGIFAPERRFVTNTEIKFAIDLKKPIILVDAGFKWEKLSPCMHLTECCENVAPEFQPYARALISALQVHRWHVDVRYRNVDMEIIIERYNTRDKEAIKLSNYVAREVVKGECMHSIHYFDDTKKPIGWTDRQHVMCEGFLSILAAVFLVISVVTYCQRYTEPVIPKQAWREATGNCLASVIGENYASFDAAKAACSVDASCTGVWSAPKHQKRTCNADHIAKGWCKLDGSICNTEQGGTTTFKP